tara:strand:- start:448 stop:594 length:147 start_codon:yes stop_codon:yes gene_type:complete
MDPLDQHFIDQKFQTEEQIRLRNLEMEVERSKIGNLMDTLNKEIADAE